MSRFFQISHDLMLAVGVESGERTVNATWERILGWSVEEVESRSILELLHPDDLEMHRDGLAALVAGAVPALHIRTRVRARDGSYRLIDWVGTLDPEAKIVYGAGRDVTDEAALAAQLARREGALSHLVAELVQVREAEQARFAGELHDGPLQNIIAAMLFLTSPDMESAHDQAAEQVQAAAESIRSIMAGLTTDRMVSGGLNYAINSIAAETSAQFRLQTRTNCELAVEPSQEIAATVCRIVREGLVNAGKHATSRDTSVEITGTSDWIKVSISDGGSDSPHVAPPVARGASYGLASLAEIVRVQHGTIDTLISAKGSTLEATLPLDAHHASHTVTADVEPTSAEASPT